MTTAEALAYAEREIDVVIDRYLVALERSMRLHVDAAGPEDDAVDQVPDPDAPWTRISVEEAVELERAALLKWRAGVLEVVLLKILHAQS